jgi:Tfp pilus assembly protein PilP
MMAGVAAAQAKPAAPPSQALKPPSAAPKSSPMTPKGAAQKSPMSPQAASTTAAKKPAAPAKATSSAKPEAAKTAAEMAAPEMAKASTKQGSKRDPFVSPIARATGGGKAGPGPDCNSGKRCLMAGQIALVGVVRSPNGMIAVVEGAQKKTYFLRENDPLFNGFVTRITGDSVTIRESGSDQFGNPSSRDVVKKLNPTT